MRPEPKWSRGLILDAVSVASEIPVWIISGRSRLRIHDDPREAYYALCLEAGWSTTKAGEWIDRNHTSVIRGARAAKDSPRIQRIIADARGLLPAPVEALDLEEEPKPEPIPPKPDTLDPEKLAAWEKRRRDPELYDDRLWRYRYPYMAEMYGVDAAKWREAKGIAA